MKSKVYEIAKISVYSIFPMGMHASQIHRLWNRAHQYARFRSSPRIRGVVERCAIGARELIMGEGLPWMRKWVYNRQTIGASAACGGCAHCVGHRYWSCGCPTSIAVAFVTIITGCI